jgi:hypothetical protein
MPSLTRKADISVFCPKSRLIGTYAGLSWVGSVQCRIRWIGVSYIQMQVDPNANVAGYPVLLVRQALRKLRHVDTWSSDLLEASAGLPAGVGRELASALAGLGLVRALWPVWD